MDTKISRSDLLIWGGSQPMDVIRPRDPVFILCGLFVPWQYINTFIALTDHKISFSRYYAVNRTQFKKKIDEIILDDVQAVGFPCDLKIKRQEWIQSGVNVLYLPQEIDFKTKNKVVALNVKPYTKKQIRFLLEFVVSKDRNVIIGKRVAKLLKQQT